MNYKIFSFAFLIALIFLVVLNLILYADVRPQCCDLLDRFGFPFALGEYGGFVTHTRLFASGFIANIVAWLLASTIFGWALALSGPAMASTAIRLYSRVGEEYENSR